MPPPDRFGRIRCDALEAGSLRVEGREVRPVAGGTITVTGSAELEIGFDGAVALSVSFASIPPAPGYVGVAATRGPGLIRLSVLKPAANGLSMVPATLPVDLNWTAYGV